MSILETSADLPVVRLNQIIYAGCETQTAGLSDSHGKR